MKNKFFEGQAAHNTQHSLHIIHNTFPWILPNQSAGPSTICFLYIYVYIFWLRIQCIYVKTAMYAYGIAFGSSCAYMCAIYIYIYTSWHNTIAHMLCRSNANWTTIWASHICEYHRKPSLWMPGCDYGVFFFANLSFVCTAHVKNLRKFACTGPSGETCLPIFCSYIIHVYVYGPGKRSRTLKPKYIQIYCVRSAYMHICTNVNSCRLEYMVGDDEKLISSNREELVRESEHWILYIAS